MGIRGVGGGIFLSGSWLRLNYVGKRNDVDLPTFYVVVKYQNY